MITLAKAREVLANAIRDQEQSIEALGKPHFGPKGLSKCQVEDMKTASGDAMRTLFRRMEEACAFEE